MWLRSIARNKSFTLVVLVVFSFGIASTSTVFTVLDAVLLKPAAFPDAARMVSIEGSEKDQNWESNVSPGVFDKLRSRKNLVSEVFAIRKTMFTVTRVPTPDQVFGFAVSGNLFPGLNAKPQLGRVITTLDDQPGAPRVVLLSNRGWKQLFNGDPSIVGKSAQLDGDLYTVIGVMPPDFVLPDPNNGGVLWAPLRLSPAEINSINARGVQVFAHLQAGVNLTTVQQDLNRIAASYPNSLQLRASPVTADTDPNQKRAIWLAMGMVCALLLIGCANLSSLLLARAIARQRDFAIRLATGASRLQLIRQALSEVFVLALASLVISGFATKAALGLIRNNLTTMGAGLPGLAHVQLNTRSLLFSFAVALFCALACGLFPALTTTSIDLASGLRQTGTQFDGRKSGRRFLHFLIAAEAALALLLLLTSGLLLRSLSQILSEDHGLRADRVLTLRLPTGAWQINSTKRTPEQMRARNARYLASLKQIQQTPGVQAAALASSLPLSRTTVSTAFSYRSQRVLVITQAVTADYFKVMGIPILAGHTFQTNASQPNASDPFLLVNQAFVQKYLNGQNPIGQFVLSEDGKEKSEIIGVVKNSPHRDLTEPIAPETYADFTQTNLVPFLTGLVVRTQGNPEALSRVLRQTISSRNADQPVVQVRTLQSLIDDNIWQPRFSAWLSSVFASLAVCLCAVGIYGVVAYISASRQREFGIRTALGAGRGNLLRLAATQSLIPVLIGSCFGLLAFYWLSKWLASLLYKISPMDPVNALAGAAIFSLVALAAVAAPALRASKVDPAITLRHE